MAAAVVGKSRSLSGSGLILVVLSAACWSMSGFFIQYVVAGSDISAWGLAFWREVVTCVLLLVGIAFFQPHLLHVKRHDLPWLAAMGALGIGLLHVTWNISVVENGMAVATVFQYNAPFFVAIAAWLIWREPLTWRKWAAILLAFLGTVLVSQFNWQLGSQITLNGMLAGLGTAVAFTNISLFGKKLSSDYSVWTILFYNFLFGAIALLPFQIGHALPGTFNGTATAAFLGLVLVPTIIGYAFYTIGLNRLQSSVAVIVATMEVPFAAVVAYLAFSQRLDSGQLLGALMVVSGVILLSWPQKKAAFVPLSPVVQLPQPSELMQRGEE
jgi:drug/metabolite transporter (DMT)-like permease